MTFWLPLATSLIPTNCVYFIAIHPFVLSIVILAKSQSMKILVHEIRVFIITSILQVQLVYRCYSRFRQNGKNHAENGCLMPYFRLFVLMPQKSNIYLNVLCFFSLFNRHTYINVNVRCDAAIMCLQKTIE